MIPKLVLLFCVSASLSALAGEDWGFWVRRYSYGHGHVYYNYDNRSSQPCDFNTAQILAAQKIPLYTPVSASSDFRITGDNSAIVTNVISGQFYTDSSGYTLSAPLYCSVKDLVRSLCNSGLSPSNFCSRVFSDSTWTYFVEFQTYPYLFNAISSPTYRDRVLGFLSGLDSGVSNILSRVIGISGDVSSLASYAPIVSADLSGIRASVESVVQSVAPSAADSWAVVSQMLFGGLGDVHPHVLLAQLPQSVRSGITLDNNGEFISATPSAESYLSSLASSLRGSSTDKLALASSLAGWSISGDSATKLEGATGFVDAEGLSHTFADLCNMPMEQLRSYSAEVSLRVDTNSVIRVGAETRDAIKAQLTPIEDIKRGLVDISYLQSGTNETVNAARKQSIEDGIKDAFGLNGSDGVIRAHIENWPDGGIRVVMDAQVDGVMQVGGQLLSQINTSLSSLHTDFREWSGVEDDGRWLVVQDLLTTNIVAILDSLNALTNSQHTLSNVMYSVASSNDVLDAQVEASNFLGSLDSLHSSLLDSFHASDSIGYGHTNFNFVASGQFAPLRQLSSNGDHPPLTVDIQIGSFGSYQFPTVSISVQRVLPICNASRWFFRCVWLVLVVMFYVWLGRLALRAYNYLVTKLNAGASSLVSS